MNNEPKPTTPGEYFGQSSPGGEWEWNGTGRPDDQWISTQPLVTVPGTALLSQAILETWDKPSIIRWCDLTTGLSSPIPQWKLWTHSVHDLAKQHGVPH